MLKYWLALLLLLNAAVLAWQYDAFARWGWGPNLHREPERLLQQINPEALRFGVPGSTEAQGAEPDAAAATPATAATVATEASADTAPTLPAPQADETSAPAPSPAAPSAPR